MKNIKAIIFDMNGVIVDDEPVHELAFKSVLKNYGVKLTSSDYRKLGMGRTDKEGFEAMIKKFGLKNMDINELIAKKSKKYLELIPARIKSVPGVVELIKKLVNRYPLALASSSTRQEIEMVLGCFKIKKYFPVIVSAENITHGKPEAEPYLLTAKKLGVDPISCLVIEDSKSGIISAKRAGMQCLAITTYHNESDLKNADYVIESFNQMPKSLTFSV